MHFFSFGIILSLRLLVKKVDNGVMSYLLSSGVKRTTVWTTEMLVIVSNMFVLILFCTGLGIICSQIMFPDKLDIFVYISINIGVYILHLALLGICFMCSSIFNEYRLATLFGAGFPIIFILIQMLSNMEGSMEWLKYMTILTLFDSNKLISGDNEAYLMLGGLAIIAIVCSIIGVAVFKRKNMSL